MSRLFYHVAQDNVGNLLLGVSGGMYLAGTGTLATIYGDEALTIILPNPMTNHTSFGSFKCYLGAGDYDFYMAKAGYTFEALTGVQGHGTMAQQNADAVAITDGTAQLDSLVATTITGGTSSITTMTATNVGINRTPNANINLAIDYLKESRYGIILRPVDNDTGGIGAIVLQNLASTNVGSITTTAAATAYNTTSDSRLKTAVAPLTGALDLVRALNPITHRWKADDSPGVSFLAHEVQAVIPEGVITGEKGAVDEDGGIIPQMIDYGKLVPYLVSAVKELTQQVEMLQAQLAEAQA